MRIPGATIDKPIDKHAFMQFPECERNLMGTLVRHEVRSRAPALIVQFVIALVGVLAIFYARLAFRMTDGFLWGEDLGVFIGEVYQIGAQSFWTPYAGYLHALPRIVAYTLAKLTSIRTTPYTYVYACVLIYAACATYLYRAALRFHDSKVFAAAIAATPFLVAQSGEVYLSITNLQWVTAPVLLVLLWDTFTVPTTRGAWVFCLIALVVLITTGPFAILFLPAIALILWVNRETLCTARSLIAVTVCMAAGLTQMIVMHFAPPVQLTPNTSHDWSHFRWAGQFARNFVVELFVPVGLIGGWWKGAGAALVLLVAASATLSRERIVCLSLLFLAVMMWAVGVYRANTPDITVHWYGYGARYLYVPFVFVAWAMIIAAVTAPAHVKWMPAVLVSAMLWTSLCQFQGGQWEKWRIEVIGNDAYRFHIAPGMQAIVQPKLQRAF